METDSKTPSYLEKTYTGRIELICGPMFSSKTSELITRAQRHIRGGKKCVAIKYAQDERYSLEQIVTHDKTALDAIPCGDTLFSIKDQVMDAKVICIDEGQFFKDIVKFCTEMQSFGKLVIVAALDMNFKRKEWPSIAILAARAYKVTKCKAVCVSCGNDAAFSKLILLEDVQHMKEHKDGKMIGGAEKYVAVCLPCHKYVSF